MAHIASILLVEENAEMFSPPVFTLVLCSAYP
jgi:hypothetical protein